jgi:hypothetical protein
MQLARLAHHEPGCDSSRPRAACRSNGLLPEFFDESKALEAAGAAGTRKSPRIPSVHRYVRASGLTTGNGASSHRKTRSGATTIGGHRMRAHKSRPWAGEGILHMFSSAATAVLAAGVALVLAGCGGGDDGASAGTISVSQVFSPQKPYGVEGTASYVSVRDDGGEVLAGHVDGTGVVGETKLLEDDLGEGNYKVIAYQRACGPSACGPGDLGGPAVIRCSGSATVAAGEMTAVLVRVKPTGHGSCEVTAAE